VHFTIEASKHYNIEPNLTNYEIPIFITADRDISDVIIDTLIFSTNRSVFYPKGKSNNISWDYSYGEDNTMEFILSNIAVPPLTENQPTKLC
jgi:hypothetical protein